MLLFLMSVLLAFLLACGLSVSLVFGWLPAPPIMSFGDIVPPPGPVTISGSNTSILGFTKCIQMVTPFSRCSLWTKAIARKISTIALAPTAMAVGPPIRNGPMAPRRQPPRRCMSMATGGAVLQKNPCLSNTMNTPWRITLTSLFYVCEAFGL